LNMGSSDRTLDTRGQLHNPPGINCPISPNVFPLGIEKAIYDVLVSEGEAEGNCWGTQEDACVQEWAEKLVQQLLFTEDEPRSVVTSANLVLWFREAYSQGLWRLDDVGRIWWKIELRDKRRFRMDRTSTRTWLILANSQGNGVVAAVAKSIERQYSLRNIVKTRRSLRIYSIMIAHLTDNWLVEALGGRGQLVRVWYADRNFP
ncbi:MAG: hypothetical protein GY702_15165, partial [Desulfobulbaceae bacterium]|nr:hypothetical protein [Desulfobulbaceae bacterium]